MTKRISPNCEKKTKKTEIVTKLINSHCEKSKTQIVTKLKNLNCNKTKINLNWDKIQIKVGQISKTQTVTKLHNSNGDKTQQLKL